jgi:hypothetical protein
MRQAGLRSSATTKAARLSRAAFIRGADGADARLLAGEVRKPDPVMDRTAIFTMPPIAVGLLRSLVIRKLARPIRGVDGADARPLAAAAPRPDLVMALMEVPVIRPLIAAAVQLRSLAIRRLASPIRGVVGDLARSLAVAAPRPELATVPMEAPMTLLIAAAAQPRSLAIRMLARACRMEPIMTAPCSSAKWVRAIAAEMLFLLGKIQDVLKGQVYLFGCFPRLALNAA